MRKGLNLLKLKFIGKIQKNIDFFSKKHIIFMKTHPLWKTFQGIRVGDCERVKASSRNGNTSA